MPRRISRSSHLSQRTAPFSSTNENRPHSNRRPDAGGSRVPNRMMRSRSDIVIGRGATCIVWPQQTPVHGIGPGQMIAHRLLGPGRIASCNRIDDPLMLSQRQLLGAGSTDQRPVIFAKPAKHSLDNGRKDRIAAHRRYLAVEGHIAADELSRIPTARRCASTRRRSSVSAASSTCSTARRAIPVSKNSRAPFR